MVVTIILLNHYSYLVKIFRGVSHRVNLLELRLVSKICPSYRTENTRTSSGRMVPMVLVTVQSNRKANKIPIGIGA